MIIINSDFLETASASDIEDIVRRAGEQMDELGASEEVKQRKMEAYRKFLTLRADDAKKIKKRQEAVIGHVVGFGLASILILMAIF